MRNDRWQMMFIVAMFTLSTLFYVVRWFVFPDPSLHVEMLRYLVDDIAFLFLQVLLVTLFIDRMAQQRERREIAQKLNMIIGSFFSEVGTDVLAWMAGSESPDEHSHEVLIPTADWRASEYRTARMRFSRHAPDFDIEAERLIGLRNILVTEKRFLLSLLANQALLEHAEFTDLMWALTHVSEELEARRDLTSLSDADQRHLEGDLQRAYSLLGVQWLRYLEHLQVFYPYLFSMAIRTNPIDPTAKAEVG